MNSSASGFEMHESQSLTLEVTQAIERLKLLVFDFDGVFTDNLVFVFQDGSEAVRCSRADGIGLRKLEQLGIEPIILSTETNPVVTARATKLNIACIQSCEDKRVELLELARLRKIDLAEIGFVGNDVNDLTCLALVGLPIVVADAHPEVVPLAKLVTRLNGGSGAVREICDLIEGVRCQ